MEFTIQCDLLGIVGKDIPMKMLTDCFSLFYFLTNATVTTEKNLLMDISVVKDA